MKAFFLILLLLIASSSCGKKRTIHIIAKNAATGLPYANLGYRVMSSRTAADGEKYRTEASGTLNENGEVMVEIRQKNRTYSVIVTEPANTCYNKQITQYFDSPYDVNGTFTFEFAECSYLKLNINNVNCMGASDNFKLYYLGRQVGGQSSNIIGALSLEGQGCFNYIGDSFSSVPIGEMWWRWEVTRNGITNIYYDTINLIENEYRVYDINY